MKAFLLAAGEGTRLRPLTLHTPKCLVPIGGTPLLEIWFKILERQGVTEVVINTHHLADQVSEFVRSLQTPIRCSVSHEPKLLGSAGTLLRNKDFVQDEESFWIVYVDNFTAADIGRIAAFHKTVDSLLTMGLFHTETPSEKGIVTLDHDRRIIGFVEKPVDPPGDLANAGIMVASPAVLDEIPERYPCDLSYDVLPKLLGRMYGWVIDEFFIDIGTPEDYRIAQEKWDELMSVLDFD